MAEVLENMQPCELDTYLSSINGNNEKIIETTFDQEYQFQSLCQSVRMYFDSEWTKEKGQNKNNSEKLLETQKKAIIGYTKEVSYYKDKIRDFLRINNMQDAPCPEWYGDIVEAIFHENWGLAGIAPWMKMGECTSAKIIGENIFFLINGKMQLQKQKISKERFEQLRKAFLLKTPKKRLDESSLELYMQSGERLSMFTEPRTIEGQHVIVFRKYIIQNLTFEEQAQRKTIPKEAIPLFKAAVKSGFRVAFVGPTGTGKTTFLLTWQKYEDPTLEGVMIQTDPEIKIHEVMPEAPIINIIADGEEFIEVTRQVRRADVDYFIVAEGRDGYAYDLILDVSNQGVNRMKTSMHLKRISEFCYEIANKIVRCYGGDLTYTIGQAANSFDYIFEFTKLAKDKSKKRLNAIYELRYDQENHEVTYHKICTYIRKTDSWEFNYTIGDGAREIGEIEDPEAFTIFEKELKKLSELFPMEQKTVLRPLYSKLGGG